MRKLLFFLTLVTLLPVQAATVYTKVNAKPANGWADPENNKYLIVYEVSDTKGYVWNALDEAKNYEEVTLTDGQITSESLADYQVTVTEEKTNVYYLKVADGYIGCAAKDNGITFTNGGKECTLQSNGSYVMLETNSNTCRFVYQTKANRFRFYYDKNKKWESADYRNISFYVLGDVEQEEAQNQLDINYAHVEMYACESKFPTQNNPYDQYFMTFMYLAQKEANDAVPQIGLEILAPTQYSIEGSYRSDYTAGKKYFINCQAGSKHSYYIFPSKAEQGWSEASINLAEMKITKVGKSTKPNAFVYHIKLVFTDSNKKIWTLDKDLDVYAWWIDCNRSGKTEENMDPVAFELESGNHNSESEEQGGGEGEGGESGGEGGEGEGGESGGEGEGGEGQGGGEGEGGETGGEGGEGEEGGGEEQGIFDVTVEGAPAAKAVYNGQFIIVRDGVTYDVLGRKTK